MPLHPIENTENLSDSYARIECKIAVDFTEEIDADLMDRIERSIHFEVGMLVSCVLGQFKMEMNQNGSSGVCEIRTRALMPAAAIAGYYREMADELDAVAEYADDHDSECDKCSEQPVDVIRGESPVSMAADWVAMDKMIEEIEFDKAAKNASMPVVMQPPAETTTTCGTGVTTTTTTTAQFKYPCGLQSGDRLLTPWGEFDVVYPSEEQQQICVPKDKVVAQRKGQHTSAIEPWSISHAFRGDVVLVKIVDGGKVKFTTVAPTDSDSRPEPCKPFEYPCGLIEGDTVHFVIATTDKRFPEQATVGQWTLDREPSVTEIAFASPILQGLIHTSHIDRASRNGVELNRTYNGDFGDCWVFTEPQPQPGHYKYPCGLMEGDELEFVINRHHYLPSPSVVVKWAPETEPTQYWIIAKHASNTWKVSTSYIATATRNGKQLIRGTTPDGVAIFAEAPIAGS